MITREDLIGTWRLVRWQRFKGGEAVDFPYGEDALGQITYDPGGYMSGFLARADWSSAAPTLEDYNTGFFSYGGTWSLHPDAGDDHVRHRVEFASYPSWIGSEQVRYVTLDAKGENGLMHLEMRPDDSPEPTPDFHRLTWQRAPNYRA